MLEGLIAFFITALAAFGIEEAAVRVQERHSHRLVLYASGAAELGLVASLVVLAHALGGENATYGAILGAALGGFAIPYFLLLRGR